MTTLVATPQPASASIAVTVNPTAPVVGLTRSDANGVHPVRTLAGVLPITGSTVVIDHEAALIGTVTYTANDGAAGASVSTALNLTGQEWLTVPALPALSVPIDRRVGRTAYTANRAGATVVHDIIGRADSPVSLGPLRLRAGSFDIWCPDHPTARTTEDVYGHAEVVFLRQGIPGLDMYHVALGTTLVPQLTTPRWLLTVNFQEVVWPTNDQIGTFGWSFADVKATYASFNALPPIYRTFNDLTIGPT